MVLVSHIYKFIYIKNRKCASTSVEAFFTQYCLPTTKNSITINPSTRKPQIVKNNRKYNTKNNIHTQDAHNEHISKFGIIGRRGRGHEIGRGWVNHISAKNIQTKLGEKIFNKYYKFSVVRNPYDKMVSMYFWAHKQDKQSFNDFCKTSNVNNLSIHTIDDICSCDVYIRFEHLHEDIKKVCEYLQLPNYNINNLPTHKSNTRKNKKHYREYYDEETRNIVYESHKKEFELFGYTF